MADKLVPLIDILSADFYPILAIIALLLTKRLRLGGILLILFRCISGQFYWIHFSLIAMIAFFTNWLDPDYFIAKKNAKTQEDDTRGNQSAKDHPVRKDPDYPIHLDN